MDIPRSASRKGPSQHVDSEFVTGNCATCDSMVRWPRNLDVYRCTICLMVNDLKPMARKDTTMSSSVGSLPSLGSQASSSQKAPRKSLTLSIERTRILIEQSISTFLKQRVSVKRAERSGSSYFSNTFSDQNNSGQRLSAHESYSSGHTGRREAYRHGFTSKRHSPPSIPQGGSSQTTGDVPVNMSRYVTLASLSTPKTTGQDIHTIPPVQQIANAGSNTESRQIFRPLENYVVACLTDCDCLNSSFALSRPQQAVRASSEASTLIERPKKPDHIETFDDPLFEVDAKTLLLGDIGENGTWWTGSRRTSEKKANRDFVNVSSSARKYYRLDWTSIQLWYDLTLTCGKSWRLQKQKLSTDEQLFLETPEEDRLIESNIAEARCHVQRTMLKAMETLLRRPGRPLKSVGDCLFLIILLSNPLLYPRSPSAAPFVSVRQQLPDDLSKMENSSSDFTELSSYRNALRGESVNRGSATGHHSGILKRLLGLIANLPNDCHQFLMSWLCRISEIQFRNIVELVGGFVSYRLRRQNNQKRSDNHDLTAGLIPNISGPGAGTSAQLHAALDTPRQTSSQENSERLIAYADDWQVRVAAKVMSLLFLANNIGKHTIQDTHKTLNPSDSTSMNPAARQRANRHFQILPTSAFYNTLLDYVDLVADFETWESRRGKFSFCQYPMFLSIWAKIRIMEHDAHRQMEIKARDAFFTSIISRKAVNQHLVVKVRRECLVDDSLRSVSEVVGTGQEEVKKGLKIEFVGEEGVDAGGLRKEWFLLLVREVFDQEHGLFVYDEESHYCYFNPNSFETSDQFFLVGVVLGLAIYNSTILDVALPPFAFRKLLASAPAYAGPSTTAVRPNAVYSLEDLAEWKPSLARGLRQLLEHNGNVEMTFCRDFVIDVDRYGQVLHIPLCPNGEQRPVTNENRREFVDLYIRYMFDTAVARQYEPFKRGFFTVCSGNALSLFRPEEIELLIRGSDEPFDTASLRAVAVYENWPGAAGRNSGNHSLDSPGDEVEVIQWFWDILGSVDILLQKKILTFITGSDRIPAMGATSLVIKIAYLTDDYRRYPVARTCFNMLGLHRYRSKEELKSKLLRAVADSEGFGLK